MIHWHKISIQTALSPQPQRKPTQKDPAKKNSSQGSATLIMLGVCSYDLLDQPQRGEVTSPPQPI
jgi:hypothetical protein